MRQKPGAIHLKKKILPIAVLLVILTAICLFVAHDSFLYQTPIAKVTAVAEEKLREVSGEINGTETTYRQTATAVLLNGDSKGQSITLPNDYQSSEVSTTKYETGDVVFVRLDGQNNTTGKILYLKQDLHIAVLLCAFLLLSVLVCGRRGILYFAGLAFNSACFFLALKLYIHGLPLVLLSGAAVVVFTAATILLTCGANRQALITAVSALATTAVTIFLAFVVLKITDGYGVRFDKMEYLSGPYEEIFFAELLIGSFGAILDTCVTISATLYQVKQHAPGAGRGELKKAGKAVGMDIMGTMSNILFFAYITGCIPMIVLALRNNVTFYDVLHNYISLEITRSLVGSIGIVLAIPIAIRLAAAWLSAKEAAV